MRIGIYPRKSVYRDNSDSVSVQVKMCKDYASILYRDEHLDFYVYDKDEGYSGKNTNRPSFKELVRDVKSGKLDIVMVYKLDRISRNVQEFATMYETMQQHDVSFISVKETFDTSTPIGRTVMYILAAFAQLERENTSERVADSMRSLGVTGRWTGGKLPTGMASTRKKVDGKEHSYLVVDNNKIGLVKMLGQMILSGYSITSLERYCRDNNITSQSGKYLNTSQIHGILTNPVYCQNDLQAYYYFQDKGCTLPDERCFDGTKGLIAYGRTKGTAQKRILTSENWIISIGIHDWVFSSDDFIAIQKRIGQNKQIRKQKHEVGILKGVLRCKCGRLMHNRVYIKNGKMFAYYYCQERDRKGLQYCDAEFVKIDVIDDMFFDKLREIRLNPEYVYLATSNGTADTDGLKKEIRAVERSLENLATQLQENISSTASKYIISQMETLDRKLDSLNRELHSEEVRKANEKTEEEERKEVFNNICFLLDNLDMLSYKEQNELVRKIVKRCVLDGKNLSISF